MITCISNNFGVAPANIQFKDYQNDKIIVLQGRFTVDTTDPDYQAAGVLRLTMPNFSFRNSHETTVFVTNEQDGAHDITLTKAWIEKGNIFCFKPVMEWDSLGEYKIFVASAFIPANKVAEVTFPQHLQLDIFCTKGYLSNGYTHYFEDAGWRQVLVFGETITWDDDDDVVHLQLANCPGVDADFVPLIYTSDLSRTMGSEFFPCSLHQGVLVISKDGMEDTTGATPKFVKLFLVKDQN